MQIRTFIIITFLAMCVVGCGGDKRPDGFPALFPCEITITQGDKPLEGADIRLMSERDSVAWVIHGRTDVNGVAKITTHAKFFGAPTGTFKVLVSKTSVTPSKYTEPPDTASAEWQKWYGQVTSELRHPVLYVKSEYDDVNTSPHSITVTKGKNRQTFDVGEPVEIIMK